jgi:hypothetical protein
MRRWTPPRISALFAAAVSITGCAIYQATSRTSDVPVGETRATVRAYLPAGELVLFPDGISLERDTIRGRGTRYSATLQRLGEVQTLPLDSVVAIEAVQGGLNAPASTVASLATGAAIVVGGIALAKAIFGSCPTVYVPADPDGEAVLFAELFSYSVAPLFEARDVDVFPAGAREGVVRMDLRNEAPETHFINHLELLEARHRAGETVVSDHEGLPLAMSGWLQPQVMRDRSGRDVAPLLSRADERTFATLPSRVASATVDDLSDHVVVEVPTPLDADSVAVDLRLRNSLLNTVLLYDFLLSGADLRGLNWLTGTMQQVGTAAEFGSWYRERMGLHVDIWDGGAWRSVGRVPDSGPIAWKSTAVVVPVPDGEEIMRIRLRFLADQWRIDRVRVASRFRRPDTRVIPVSGVVGGEGYAEDGAMREALLAPDERYLETRPGDAVFVEFDTGEAEAGDVERTFLLASQGYYTEWIRPDWLRADATSRTHFEPDDESLVRVLARWRDVQDGMESQFEATRLPTVRGGGR